MREIPTLQQLFSSILADLEAEYGEQIPAFGKSFLVALASVQAGKLNLIYKAIGAAQREIFVDTATPEAQGGTLERWCKLKLNRNPFPATAAQYTVEVNGSVGAVIPSSTTYKSDDNSLSPGKLFILDNEYRLQSETDSITLRALEVGTESTLQAGDTLTPNSPIAAVDSSGVVLNTVVTPLAAETLEQYRALGLQSFRLEPQGGSGSDFRLWASDAQGVKQSYPYTKSGGNAGDIDLFIESTIEDSADGKGTPTPEILEAVTEAIERDPDATLANRGRRPIGGFFIDIQPISIKDVRIDIAGFVGITDEVAALIFSAIKTEIDKIRPFVASIDIIDERNDVLDVNRIISTVLTARPGSTFGTVTITVDGVSGFSFQFENGNIPFLSNDSITYS